MAAGAGAVAGAADKPALQQQHQQQQQFSAAAAAGRIKYADPRSLPSFPSSGLAPNSAAASAAATLGWANQKTVEFWKPDRAASASAAAVLASDYKMASFRESPANSDGYKAAILAVGSAGAALKQANTAKPPTRVHDSWGNSAAMQAFLANRPASAEPPNLSHGSSAATQAFNTNRSLSTRKAASSGAPLNDNPSGGSKDLVRTRQRAASNALDGATRAHRASMQVMPPTDQAGAVSVVTMTRKMFTSAPPVKHEVDERCNNERLHQSAVEMAKKMYSQQKMADQAKSAHIGQPEADQPSPYLNLQDAAYKQAQERLAKLHNEHMKSREYQEYYGNANGPPRHRLSVAAKLRRRLSDSDTVDRQRSREIRDQMSMFSNKLSQVDREKREKDREALLAAAQRNVKARLQTMDEKAQQETGRPSPARLTEWEVKAQQAAQSRHDSRIEKKGMVDIGGGKFMSPEEVDAIATKKVQPVLDDINEKAEAERERQAVLRMEEEARREEDERQKARDREAKEIQKKTKEQEKQEEKAKKLQVKHEEKAKRDEAKAAKAEERQYAKNDSRKSKYESAAMSHLHDEDQIDNAKGATRQNEALSSNPSGRRPPMEMDDELSGMVQRKSELATSPSSKVKVWIKNRFSRGKSLSETGDKRRSFFGGAAMREHDANRSTTSLDKRSISLREVAMSGKSDGAIQREGAGSESYKTAAEGESDRDSKGVSPASTPLEEEDRRLGDGIDRPDGPPSSLEPPRPIGDVGIRVSSSPTRDSRFREMIDR